MQKINVASKESSSGHWVSGAEDVALLDKETETSLISGGGLLEASNHHPIKLKKDRKVMITIQNVFNPFTGLFEKSLD